MLILAFSSVIYVRLANLFNTPFGIALNVAFVWVISLFRYLSSLFSLGELEILTLRCYPKIILGQGMGIPYLLSLK